MARGRLCASYPDLATAVRCRADRQGEKNTRAPDHNPSINVRMGRSDVPEEKDAAMVEELLERLTARIAPSRTLTKRPIGRRRDAYGTTA